MTACVSAAQLAALEARWAAAGWPHLMSLRAGVSEADLEAAEGALGVSLPTEISTWYRWHDGADRVMHRDIPRDLLLSSGFRPLSLAEAIEKTRWTWHELDKLGDGRDIVWRNHDWIALGEYGGGQLVGAGLVTADETSWVALLDWEELGRVPAPSLGTVVSWWIEALDRRIVRWNDAIGGWEFPTQMRPENQVGDQRTGLIW